MESRLSAVVLSRGSTWKPQSWEPPYLLATDTPWPSGSAYIRFYDSAGAQIGADIDGEVTSQAITFTADPSVVDAVPAGANFEIFLDTGDVSQIRYGKVIRREAEFFDNPGLVTTYQALQFTDSFPTLGLKSSWKPVAGQTQVYDNSASSLPNSVGSSPVFLFFGAQQSALRWFAPLNSDTFRVNVNLLNQGDGKTTVIVAADILFTTYLGVQFEEVAGSTHLIHFCKGTGPIAVTYVGSSISNTVADGDNYTVYYNHATDTISVYKGTSGTPLGSYTDSSHTVPHGPGYRYFGLNWVSGNGIQVSYISAKDDV